MEVCGGKEEAKETMETAAITQIEVKFQVRWIPAGNGRDCPTAPDTPAQQSSSSTPPSSPVGSGGRPEPERPPPLPEFQSASSWTENVSGGSQWCRLKCTHSSPLCFGPPPVSHTLLVQTCSHGWSLTSVWKTTPSFLWYLKSLPLLRTLSLSFLSTCFLFLSSFTKPMVCPLCSAGLFRTSTDPPERWCFLFSPPGTGLLTALGESFLIFLLFSLGLEENAQPRSGHPQGDFVLSSWSQRSWMHRMLTGDSHGAPEDPAADRTAEGGVHPHRDPRLCYVCVKLRQSWVSFSPRVICVVCVFLYQCGDGSGWIIFQFWVTPSYIYFFYSDTSYCVTMYVLANLPCCDLWWFGLYSL